jgi:hypothetical protein
MCIASADLIISLVAATLLSTLRERINPDTVSMLSNAMFTLTAVMAVCVVALMVLLCANKQRFPRRYGYRQQTAFTIMQQNGWLQYGSGRHTRSRTRRGSTGSIQNSESFNPVHTPPTCTMQP